MSHQATAWAYGVRGLTPAQKLVLYHLANRCNEGHAGYEQRSICWPSLSRLQDDCELSRRGLTLILSVLEGRHLVRRIKGHGFAPARGKGGEATLYELPLNAPPACPKATSSKAGDMGAGKDVPLSGEQSLPKPVREPVRENLNPETGDKDDDDQPEIPTSQEIEDEEFEQFYRAYPRKKAPKRARLAFRAARRDADMADIMHGLEGYLKAVSGKKPDYIQHPASWLNGGCWMDRPDGKKGGYGGISQDPADARNVFPGLEGVVTEFGPAMWNSWLADCRFERRDDGVYIGTKGKFQEDYIRNNFGGRLSEIAGCPINIHTV